MAYKLILAITLFIALGACSPPALPESAPPRPAPTKAQPPQTLPTSLAPTQEVEMTLQITSPAFEAGGSIPARFTCLGENISPALNWGEPPEGTNSFVLIMDDPDATNGTFVHWVIFNIPASSRGLPEALPMGAKLEDGTLQGLGGSRDHGYIGPCPPSGTHRYFFKLYALDSLLNLSSDAGAGDLMNALSVSGRILDSAQLMGTFRK